MNKPFDLQKALAGDLVVTRCGQKVIKVFDSGLDIKYPLAVWIDGEIEARTYAKNGYYSFTEIAPDDCIEDGDLLMAPKKRTVWVNLMLKENQYYEYKSKEQAEKIANASIGPYLAIAVPVEIEE